MCEVVIYTTGKSLNWLWKSTLKGQSAGTTAGSIWPTFLAILGVQEHLKQDSEAMKQKTATEFLQRVRTIWLSALLDVQYKVDAENGFAAPSLRYLMKTIYYDLSGPQRDWWEIREILSDVLARHPAVSGAAHLYLPRTMGRRWMNSPKQTYREVKIKTAIHLHNSDDPAMKASTKVDRARMKKGRRSILKKLDSIWTSTTARTRVNSNLPALAVRHTPPAVKQTKMFWKEGEWNAVRKK